MPPDWPSALSLPPLLLPSVHTHSLASHFLASHYLPLCVFPFWPPNGECPSWSFSFEETYCSAVTCLQVQDLGPAVCKQIQNPLLSSVHHDFFSSWGEFPAPSHPAILLGRPWEGYGMAGGWDGRGRGRGAVRLGWQHPAALVASTPGHWRTRN